MSLQQNLAKMAELLNQKQKPKVADNVIAANGHRLSDLLPRIGQPVAESQQPNRNWIDDLAPQIESPTATLPPIGAVGDVPTSSILADKTAEQSILPAIRPRFVEELANRAVNPSLPPIGSADTASGLPVLSNSVRQRVVPFGQLSQDEQIGQDTRRLAELQSNPLPKEGIWKRLLNGALEGLSHADTSNGLGGVLGSVIGGAGVDAALPKIEAQQRTNREIAKVGNRLNTSIGLKDRQIEQRGKLAQIANSESMPEYRQGQIEQKGKELDERSRANAMRVVASVYNRLPSFDSKDPNNADVVEQMQSLGIPVIDKTPNKDVKYVQDEDSGEMFMLSTDKQTGETSAEQVLRNGEPLKITTKTQIGMKTKDLDRASREKIAEARNNTLLKVTGMNAGSRERVAEMNSQGAGERVDKQIKAADDRQKTQLTANALSRWRQQFAKSNFRQPTEAEIAAAKESIQKTVYGQ